MTNAQHIETGLLESHALAKTAFEVWAERVEKVLGHDLDGDQSSDGYSLDGAYKSFNRGQGVADYVDIVEREKELRSLLAKGDSHA